MRRAGGPSAAEREADGDGLTVAEVETAGDLEGVGERVPVVEQRPATAFALVAGDHVGLDGHAAATRAGSGSRSRSPPPKKWYLASSPMPLRYSRAGERGEGVGVAHHGGGLPERPDQVLALGQVDPGLAADGGVDLAERVVATCTTAIPRW